MSRINRSDKQQSNSYRIRRLHNNTVAQWSYEHLEYFLSLFVHDLKGTSLLELVGLNLTVLALWSICTTSYCSELKVNRNICKNVFTISKKKRCPILSLGAPIPNFCKKKKKKTEICWFSSPLGGWHDMQTAPQPILHSYVTVLFTFLVKNLYIFFSNLWYAPLPKWG